MHLYQKLIVILLLVSCNSTIDKPLEFLPIVEEEQIEPKTNTLLESIDSTLNMADEAIDDIVNQQQATGRKISQLQKTINEEEKIIGDLQVELITKDSIILFQCQEIENHLTHIHDVESSLNSLIEKHTNKYIPTISNLTRENKQLHDYIDSLEFKIKYMDSLILTNKRLTKTYEYEH